MREGSRLRALLAAAEERSGEPGSGEEEAGDKYPRGRRHEPAPGGGEADGLGVGLGVGVGLAVGVGVGVGLGVAVGQSSSQCVGVGLGVGGVVGTGVAVGLSVGVGTGVGVWTGVVVGIGVGVGFGLCVGVGVGVGVSVGCGVGGGVAAGSGLMGANVLQAIGATKTGVGGTDSGKGVLSVVDEVLVSSLPSSDALMASPIGVHATSEPESGERMKFSAAAAASYVLPPRTFAVRYPPAGARALKPM